MRAQITLRGADAEQFEEVADELADDLRADLSNAETVRRLMEHYEANR